MCKYGWKRLIKRISVGLLLTLFLMFVIGCGGGGQEEPTPLGTAKSSAYEDVQAAIDNAQDGDVVRVPEGTAVWDRMLVITKSVYLIGAGIDKTIIYNGITNTGTDDFIFKIEPANPSENPAIRVTGFTLDANNDGGCISIANASDEAYHNFRIDHNKLINTEDEDDSYMCIRVRGHCFGLIDHNEFENNQYDFKVYGSMGKTWDMFPGVDNIGTKNYLYIEDNTSTNPQTFILTSGEGARWVYRYNRIFGKLALDAHGDTRNRGVVAHEIYENTATNDFDPVTGGGFSHDYRGGTGIIFNNRAQIGTSGTRGKIQVREEHEACTYSGGCDSSPGGDQVNNGYIWNNRNTRDNNIIAIWESDTYNHIAEDKDWWDDADRAPGGESPTNFHYGPAANRHETSRDNDCYWEEDTLRLYRSVGDDNWVFIYTPYTYPHPLRTSGPLAD